ncbi:dihydropteroate synthase [Xanthobacter autotrophicus]|uniref:dihydropteroate synthase n=1 Tax=Xanthobacter autotrophicus TaxID=280 RepID=UPI001E5E56AA|nr:dihydropteroate synthase [Xanthobacter autotrophicus]UDQ90784.1 dihydropteroate synthase [Xanthobacter autotrophicus]
MPAAPSRTLLARGHALHLGPRTLIMGILNVTPDSFSDGGRSAAPDDALANARRLVAEGAEILDVGGESTRPGHTPVAAEDEWARIAPVIPALVAEMGVPVSVDTYKAEVARRALEAGASIVNDVWGFTHDPDMAKVVADYDAAAVVMHNRTEVDESLDIISEMLGFFERVLEIADRAGVKREKLVLDPGIGFGKSFPQNLAAIRRLPELRVLGLPILLGTSRKSLIGKVIQTTPQERVPGTIASNVIAIMEGVEIIRVHDVAAHVQAARVAEAIRDAS